MTNLRYVSPLAHGVKCSILAGEITPAMAAKSQRIPIIEKLFSPNLVERPIKCCKFVPVIQPKFMKFLLQNPESNQTTGKFIENIPGESMPITIYIKGYCKNIKSHYKTLQAQK